MCNFITRPRAEGDGVLRFNEPFALSTLPGVGGEVICNQIKTKQNYCMLKIKDKSRYSPAIKDGRILCLKIFMVWIVFSHMWENMMFCYFHCSPVAAIFSWKLRYLNIQRVRLHNVIMGKLFISLFLIFCALMIICIKSAPLSVYLSL